MMWEKYGREHILLAALLCVVLYALGFILVGCLVCLVDIGLSISLVLATWSLLLRLC